MKHGFTVVDEGVEHLARPHRPDAHCRVGRPGDNDVLVVLQAEHGPRVACQNLYAVQRVTVPDLGGTEKYRLFEAM